MATFKEQSPVRRSLIDCIEKPLRRRSVTPPDGGPVQEEDWPTIEPAKSDHDLASAATQSQVMPSLGESLYEGMRALNLRDKDNPSQVETIIQSGDNPVSFATENQDMAPELLSDGKYRPLSSSQLPKPRDSMLNSLSRHVDGPPVRQTKTSALRLQQATGKSTWQPGQKNKSTTSHLPSTLERTESPRPFRSQPDHRGGPIRTNSRGRYGVTGRGSPYTITSQVNSTLKPGLQNESNARQQSFDTPTNGHSVKGSQDDQAGRSNSLQQQMRKSSLPLPARFVHEGTTLGDQHAAEDSSAKSSVNPTTKNQQDTPGEPANQPRALDVKEVLSTPAPADDVSVDDSDEETSEVSIHGYDSYGGYRIRRVGNNNGSKLGPTLRITDSASRVLLGQEDEPNVLNARGPNTLRRQGSAPDIASPRMAEKQARRSSAILTSPFTFVKSFTDQSTTQLNTEGNENWNLVDSNGSADTVVRAELPGDLPSWNSESATDKATEQNIAASFPRENSNRIERSRPEHRDWPGNDFANFNVPSESAPGATSANGDPEPVVKRRLQSKSPSRPPTIVLREAPSQETAPFLFQDLKEEQAKQDKLADDLAKASGSSATSSLVAQPVQSDMTLTDATATFPPRVSSRKPKPPPIIISPPHINLLVPKKAPNAYAVRADSIKKPRNVKTFSQSRSPHPNLGKDREISGVLAHSPSSSSKKKMVSSLRGLFHKKSFESNKAAESTGGGTPRDIEPVPKISAISSAQGVRNFSRSSFRRKPVPGFGARGAEKDSPDTRYPNPLKSQPESWREADLFGDRKKALGGHSDHKNDNGNTLRPLRHKNATISPTTPFTANLKTPAVANSPADTTTVDKGTSPTLPLPHGHLIPSPSLSLSSTSTPILSTASALTHSLLDMARACSSPGLKAPLIELSKCMVEVVSAARDAEKAMEKAKMEAARAEVSYLKCLKEVGAVESTVGKILKDRDGDETGRNGYESAF